MSVCLFVPGRPAPQGSKRYVGRGISVESSKAVAPWRADVRDRLLDAEGQPIARFDGPVTVTVEFVLPRPASTPKRRTPPAVRRPDLDKLARAVLDAVGSAGVWRDDSQVIELIATKRIAELSESVGAQITIVPASACSSCGAEAELAGPSDARYLFQVHDGTCAVHPEGPSGPRVVR